MTNLMIQIDAAINYCISSDTHEDMNRYQELYWDSYINNVDSFKPSRKLLHSVGVPLELSTIRNISRKIMQEIPTAFFNDE